MNITRKMQLKLNMKSIRVLSIMCALTFMLIHVVMYLVFRQNHVIPMVRFNIFSITFYFIMIFVAYKGWIMFFATATYFEVIAHMTLSVIFTGWESGFQITLIGMCILLLFTEYVGRILDIPRINITFLGAVGFFCYIGSYIWIHYHPARYTLSDIAVFKPKIPVGLYLG